MFGLGTFGVLWMLTPGLPVLRAPRASAEARAAGLELFEHEWQPHDPLARGDGLGPVFNARSCVECHFQGGAGGGGDNKHNVLAFEAFPTQDRPEVKGGLIHRFAVANHFLEGRSELKQVLPDRPRRDPGRGWVPGLHPGFRPGPYRDREFHGPLRRGWVDRISGKTIRYQSLRTATAAVGNEIIGNLGGVVPGRPRVLPDGRVGKFGWKAQFATLEEFVAAACANEIGLGNPRMEQARPMVRLAYPQVERDLTDAQFRSLVAFVNSLPRPVEAAPADPDRRRRSERGKALFGEIGCAVCHTPDVAGVEGVYSDFLLHRLDDRSRGGGRRLPRDAPGPAAGGVPAARGVEDAPPLGSGGFRPVFPRRRLPDPGVGGPAASWRCGVRDGRVPEAPCRRSGRAHRLLEDAPSPLRRRARLPRDDREAPSGHEPVVLSRREPGEADPDAVSDPSVGTPPGRSAGGDSRPGPVRSGSGSGRTGCRSPGSEPLLTRQGGDRPRIVTTITRSGSPVACQ